MLLVHKLRSRRYEVAQALFHLLRIQPLELHALLHPKIISSVKLTLRTARLTNQHRRRRRRSLQVFIARQQEIPNPFAPFARLTQMKAKFLHSLEPGERGFRHARHPHRRHSSSVVCRSPPSASLGAVLVHRSSAGPPGSARDRGPCVKMRLWSGQRARARPIPPLCDATYSGQDG